MVVNVFLVVILRYLFGISFIWMQETYVWMHEHFPHIVDCQPIDVVGLINEAGLSIQQKVELAIWTMPVRCVVATVS